MLGLGKKKDKNKPDDQPKKDTTTDGLGYPAGSGILPDDLKQKPITDKTVTDTTKAKPQPAPSKAVPSAQPTTPPPAPTTQPAQPVGFINDDELQIQSSPAQELTEAEKKRKELLELIQRQQAGMKQEEPVAVTEPAPAPAPAPTPPAQVEPTPTEPVKPEERLAPEIPPVAAAVEPVTPAPVPTPAPITTPPTEVEEAPKPLPTRPFAPSPEEVKAEPPMPAGTLEQRVAKLEAEMTELKKQVSKWV